MRYLIVTQTYPPRTRCMQNVMDTITTKLSSINETLVFSGYYFKLKNSNSKIYNHMNFSPKLLRPIIIKKLVRDYVPFPVN